ncbi:RAD51-associated protein 1 [Carettochelys insculpta]|uniref:RAD51-associated protein 1 n=1 Tax=Carettochelys insculpta TaxID=44489 RepID=UPI003EBF0088
MERPVRRNKKIVDYSQFGDFENDDEDFACIPAPSNKKSRVVVKETKREKREKQRKPHKEVTTVPKKTPGKRIALDDKLYQRDLEVALALSVTDPSADIPEEQDSQEKDTKKCVAVELENIDSSLLFSGSEDSGLLGPSQVTEGNDIATECSRQRRAVSKGVSQQKLLTDDSDEGDHADNYEPAFASDEESEGDSDFSEEDDEDFAAKKKKTDKNKRKQHKLKVQTEKEKRAPKSRNNATAKATPVVSSPLIVQAKSQSTMQKSSSSPEPVGTPLYTSSPSRDKKKPKWIPPAASGFSSNPLGGISVRSPTQGLRLGLSRLARVKPLHPAAASS